MLHEDPKIRKLISELPECKNADIAEVEIIRHPQRVTIVVHTARPGVIIGVKGATIEKIGAEIQKSLTKRVQIKIKENQRAEVKASLLHKILLVSLQDVLLFANVQDKRQAVR